MTIAAHGRPSSRSLVAVFLRRDWEIARSYPLPLALELAGVALTTLLFFFLARVVDGGGPPDYEGMERGYFAFAVVGMAVLRMMQSALTSFATKIREEQTIGTLEALLGSPAPTSAVVLSSAAYDLVRGLVSAVALMTVAVALGLRMSASPSAWLAAAVALAGLVTLSAALGIAVAAFGVVYKQPLALLGLAVSGLGLLGGVWFPTSVLPGALRTAADALPFTWGIEALRAALVSGRVDALRIAGLAAAAAVALPVGVTLFARAVDRARRRGSLSGY